MNLLNTAKNILLNVLPTHCPLCNLRAYQGECCQSCESELPWLKQTCKRCGYTLSINAQNCGACLKNSPPYDHTVALFRYEPPIDHVLLSVKFRKHLAYAHMLGEIMTRKIQTEYLDKTLPTLILPVPLHQKRLKERGYNQALEIVRPIARHLNIPLSLHDCVRTMETQPQAMVSANQRKQNVRKAFTLVGKIQAKHVAIFDDVVTTGSTVAEITQILKKNGVEKVDVWCCARTL
ncbi:MAG: hypothetical protein K0Q74_377 [Gammaproteobacteria bacterium]|nr:hypothetical protein [Gammaproteobacteria bacterium]